MKSLTLQNSTQFTSVFSKVLLLTVLASELIGILQPSASIAAPFSLQKPPILIATAYTDITLPTLRKGDQGKSVQMLQRILLDNGFLGAAGVRLGNPSGVIVDGVYGSITEAAVRDLQQRYQAPVTGKMNPQTWEVLDVKENPYRSPLPWKL
jgi:peptidoglycan hydrolase-like protein with peptidoglycan-binding domain